MEGSRMKTIVKKPHVDEDDESEDITEVADDDDDDEDDRREEITLRIDTVKVCRRTVYSVCAHHFREGLTQPRILFEILNEELIAPAEPLLPCALENLKRGRVCVCLRGFSIPRNPDRKKISYFQGK